MQRLVLGMLVACGSGIADPADRAPRAVASPAAAVAATAARPAVAEVVTPVMPSCVEDGKPYDERSCGSASRCWPRRGSMGARPAADGDVTTRKFITERFDCLGSPRPVPASSLPFTTGGQHTANVVGYVKGSDATVGSEIVLVAAHHDSPRRGLPRRHDNASGLSPAVDRAGRPATRARPRPHDRVRRVRRREGGMLGSYEYAKTPPGRCRSTRSCRSSTSTWSAATRPASSSRRWGHSRASRASCSTSSTAVSQAQCVEWRAGTRARTSSRSASSACRNVFCSGRRRALLSRECDTADQVDYPHMVEISRLAAR